MNKPMQDAVTQRVEGWEETHHHARRNPWIAGFFSCIAPGLGHLYNGKAVKALLIYSLSWGVILANFAILLRVPLAPWNVVIPVLMSWSWYLYVILDAVRMARRHRNLYHLKAYNKWYVYLLFIVINAAIGGVWHFSRREYVTQGFKIPSGGMEDTLLIGDHVLVNKFAYRRRDPARGDIVVFPFPRDPSLLFIKRVVGVPGDRIAVRDHRVYLNGEPLNEPYVKFEDEGTLQFSPYRNWGPEVVPPGKLFVLGDRRDNTIDSRNWGFLDSATVKGRVFLIYWSWDDREGIRWRRIGKRLD